MAYKYFLTTFKQQRASVYNFLVWLWFLLQSKMRSVVYNDVIDTIIAVNQ